MPTYRICWPDGPELLEADSIRDEGMHAVLRGTALVIGVPREIVVRRVPRDVLVEIWPEPLPAEGRASWAVR